MAQREKRKGGNPPPISAHPVFPAIVALWFAALFGIGAMVLPVALIETIVVATGLPAIFEAAAPPIGFTARLSMGLFAAILGAMAGLLIARKVVAAQAAPKSASRAAAKPRKDAPAKRPIFATEELGEEGLGPVRDEWEEPLAAGNDESTANNRYASTPGNDTPEDFLADDAELEEAGTEEAKAEFGRKSKAPGRRRSLSLTDEGVRSEYLGSVPLPGDDFLAADSGEQDVFPAAGAFDDKPADLTDTVAEDEAGERQVFQQAATNDGTRPFDAGPADQVADTPDYHTPGEHNRLDANELARFANPIGSELGPQSDDAALARAFAAHEAPEDTFETPSRADTFRMPEKHESTPEEAAMAHQPIDAQRYNPFVDQHAGNASMAEAPDAADTRAMRAPAAPVDAAAPSAPAQADLAEMSMAELVDRFAKSLQDKAAATQLQEAAPLVFRRSHNPPEAGVPVATAAHSPAVPGHPAEQSTAQIAQSLPAPAPERVAGQAFRNDGQAISPDRSGEAPHSPADGASFPSVDEVAIASASSARPFGAPEATNLQPAADQNQNAVPAALRPLDLTEMAMDDEDEDDSVSFAGLGLGEGGLGRLFVKQDAAGDPFAAPAPQPDFSVPEQATQPAPIENAAVETPLELTVEDHFAEDDGDEDNFSSLLGMKNALGGNREFVRIEENDEAGAPDVPEQVVVFPGQGIVGAAPSPDALRPFDAPPEGEQARGGLPAAGSTAPMRPKADPAQTEQALRDALEKLQRMSGTG